MYVYGQDTFMTDINVKNSSIFSAFDVYVKNSGIFLTFSTFVEIFDYFGSFGGSSFGKTFAKAESEKKTTQFRTTFGRRQCPTFDFRLSRNTKFFWQTHGLR